MSITNHKPTNADNWATFLNFGPEAWNPLDYFNDPFELSMLLLWGALWAIGFWFVRSVVKKGVFLQNLGPIFAGYCLLVIVGTAGYVPYFYEGHVASFLYNVMGPETFYAVQSIAHNYFSVLGLMF